MKKFPPERIICLTEETVETLYLLGQQDRIVGVSGYAVRPKGVRKEKPRVSAFTSANIDKILALEPDLVLTFSDLQADIVADLIKQGIPVIAYNQRDLAGVFAMIKSLGALTETANAANALVDSYRRKLDAVAKAQVGRGMRVYFEEWNDPYITGIGWVSELIEMTGAVDCFGHLKTQQSARDRIVSDADIIKADPNVILASWCGKKVRPETILSREGWSQMSAVQLENVFEIKSTIILQPGPAALSDGLDAIIQALEGAKKA